MGNHVKIQEVGPRDGLQNQKTILNPRQRAELINLLIGVGLRYVQVGSFVNQQLVPQMAKTDEVLCILGKPENVRLSVLVLNERGLDLAIEAGARHVEIFVSASESHSRKNTGMPRETATRQALKMVAMASEAGLTVSAGVMCAFGCEFEGQIDPEAVYRIVSDFIEKNPDEISLADTTGKGRPDSIERMLQKIERNISLEKISLHLHDTYGNAEKNLARALEIGVRMFDSSVGGMGGCPFIPGAAGNISTEKVISLLDQKGFHTGIDVGKLTEANSFAKSLLNSGHH